MLKKFILLFLLKLTVGFIKYDSGLILQFDYDYASFGCNNGYSKTTTPSFAGTFQNIPQVFFYLSKMDWDRAELDQQLSITQITTTSFTIVISCAKKPVYRTQIRWFAIDDQRIEVINNFNMVSPQDQTFQIKNPNAQYGFLILNSIRHTGPINFQLSVFISQITTNSVTVTITKDETKFANLKTIGYQIVVGIQEAFVNLGLQTPTGGFSSGVLQAQSNSFFIVALQGFNYDNNNNIRIQTVITTTASTLSYTFGSWNSEPQTPNRHSQVWVAYQFTSTFKALECFTIRTSRKEVLDFTNIPSIYLELVSLNQVYTTIGNYNYVIHKSVNPIGMNIQLKCPNNKKIQANFNKCNSCNTQKYYSYSYNCFNKMNYVGFFPVFKQTLQQYNQIKINLQASSLEIIQVVYDYTITELMIAKVQVLDQ